MAGQPGFFDADERLKVLSASGDPLERLVVVVDFTEFRELEAALARFAQSPAMRRKLAAPAETAPIAAG